MTTTQNDEVRTFEDMEFLLKKYIEHIGKMEGVDFIPKKSQEIFNSVFSPREIRTLHRLTGWDAENERYVG